MTNSDTFEQLRGKLDGNESFMTKGHQIIKLRQGSHKIPQWTKSDKRVREILLRSFPKMKTDLKQRQRAGRWLRVIHLYYRMNFTASKVAQELQMKVSTVKDVLVHIRRVQQGRRANNSGPLKACTL